MNNEHCSGLFFGVCSLLFRLVFYHKGDFVEYLIAWIFAQRAIEKKGGHLIDPNLVKYVEQLVLNVQSLVSSGFVKKNSKGNFVLAEIADLQVQIHNQEQTILKLMKLVHELGGEVPKC